jgi:DNA-damage-inducible protein J
MTEKIESGTVNISIRLDMNLKKEVEFLFSEIGMNMTTAINIFLRRCLMENKIPFEIGLRRPNKETIEAIEEIEAMIRGDIPKRTISTDDLFGKK